MGRNISTNAQHQKKKKGASTKRTIFFPICLFDKKVLNAYSVLGSVLVTRNTKIKYDDIY